MKTVTLETMRRCFDAFVKSIEKEIEGTTITLSEYGTYPEWYNPKKISQYDIPPLNNSLDRMTFKLEIVNTKPKPKIKHEIVQLLNPRSHRYVKVDKTVGGIIAHKKSPNPYKNIPIISKGKHEVDKH